MVFFDYIFYRVARFFYKKDGLNAVTAQLVVSLIQVQLTGEIIIGMMRTQYSLTEIRTMLEGKVKPIAISVAIGFMLFNYIRYKKKYWRFSEKWKDSETRLQTKVRGWLVILAILIPFLLVVWMGTSGSRQ